MSEWQYEREKDEDEDEPREDTEAFCPRIDEQVLILNGCCFHRERSWGCFGCVFNRCFVIVKLTILLKELLEASCYSEKLGFNEHGEILEEVK